MCFLKNGFLCRLLGSISNLCAGMGTLPCLLQGGPSQNPEQLRRFKRRCPGWDLGISDLLLREQENSLTLGQSHWLPRQALRVWGTGGPRQPEGRYMAAVWSFLSESHGLTITSSLVTVARALALSSSE